MNPEKARNAAILNFLVWGTGYAYLKRRHHLAWLLFIGFAFSALSLFYLWLNFLGFKIPGIFVSIAHVFISAALAYDAWREVEEGKLL